MKSREIVYVDLPELPNVKEVIIDNVLYINLSAVLESDEVLLSHQE